LIIVQYLTNGLHIRLLSNNINYLQNIDAAFATEQFDFPFIATSKISPDISLLNILLAATFQGEKRTRAGK
jgi:hypothetical protein